MNRRLNVLQVLKNVQAAILENYEMQSKNVPGNSTTRKTVSSKLFSLFALLPLN